MPAIPERPSAPLTLGISECLLGANVRYDGGHKKSVLPQGSLQKWFVFVGLCPEVAIGLGVPRPPIHLQGPAASPKALTIDGRADHTNALRIEADRVASELNHLCGYLFMHRSPSCGLANVKVYNDQGAANTEGRGIYAAQLTARLPQLPVVEAQALHQAAVREQFVMRTFVYGHWQRLMASTLTPAKLIEFHSRYKYLLMAYSNQHYQDTGRLLSNLSESIESKANQYIQMLMTGLAKPATRRGHVNAMAHLQGYAKTASVNLDKQNLTKAIDAYRTGQAPLHTALTLLRRYLQHHATGQAQEYALKQYFLDPLPKPNTSTPAHQ